jgi:hypothetical protein
MTSTTPMLLLTVGLLFVVGTLLWQTLQDTKEGFQVRSYTVRDLEINTCPTYAPEIQTAKGNTDCCSGDLVDGKCNGSTFCTKSPAYEGVKACTDAWREYFEKKGMDLCPGTMRNYYEDVTNPGAMKGCSAGPIRDDGVAPTDAGRPQCKIYPSETENKTKRDSCYLEKRRSQIQCPVVNGQSPQADLQIDRTTNLFQMFVCQYPFEPEIPNVCYEKNSLFEYMDKTNPSWRTQSFQAVNDQTLDNYIARRQRAQDEKRRLEAERRAKEDALRRLRDAQNRLTSWMSRFRRSSQDQSRLQQQLDEANRRARECRR